MTLREEQPSLFDAPPRRPARRRRRNAETSLDALDSLGPDRATKTARILAAIRTAGVRGVTRQELAAQLHPKIEINAICGCVDHLLHAAKLVFEPLRGAVGPADYDARRRVKKGLYLLREGRKLLVAMEYLDRFPETKAELESAA